MDLSDFAAVTMLPQMAGEKMGKMGIHGIIYKMGCEDNPENGKRFRIFFDLVGLTFFERCI